MKSTTNQLNRRSQHGLAMVEFTIVLPLMLLLILGVTELGRVMVRYNTLTKAVRDGARYAAAFALRGTSGSVNVDTQLQTEVRNLAAYGNIAGTGTPLLEGLTPEQVSVVDIGGGQVRVSVNYPYQALIGPTLPTFGLGPSSSMSFNMQAAVSMAAL